MFKQGSSVLTYVCHFLMFYNYFMYLYGLNIKNVITNKLFIPNHIFKQTFNDNCSKRQNLKNYRNNNTRVLIKYKNKFSTGINFNIQYNDIRKKKKKNQVFFENCRNKNEKNISCMKSIYNTTVKKILVTILFKNKKIQNGLAEINEKQDDNEVKEVVTETVTPQVINKFNKVERTDVCRDNRNKKNEKIYDEHNGTDEKFLFCYI
ncbi:conserved protein, unknown function [Hepatocystis sp. ex Piliocolobus tephrosceles]|nr:conserved protein, unknown function [Hepatocystis sp. ex Piliocolobus tephrosceles]